MNSLVMSHKPLLPHVWELEQSKIRNTFAYQQRKAALSLLDWLGMSSKSWDEIYHGGQSFGYVRAKESGWIESVFVAGGASKWRLSLAGSMVLRELEVINRDESK